MRYVLLLIILTLCPTISAKNKVYTAPVKSQSLALKSIENSILNSEIGIEFNGSSTALNPSYHTAPSEGTFYQDENLMSSSHFFGYSDFSYKKIQKFASGGTVDVKEVNIASLDTDIIFRQGMYYGFALMLVLLNVVCFFIFDEKPFLYYALALTAMTVLLFFSDGLFSLIGIHFDASILPLQTFFLCIAAGCSAVFLSKYLTLEEFIPKLKMITLPVFATGAFLCLLGWINDSTVLLKIANAVLFTVVGIYFIAGIALFSKKNYAKFFVIASFVPLLFILDYFVLSPIGINFLRTHATHIKAATIAEMLIMTYAVMYRMQAIKEEGALRQAELRIFLKRQEAMTNRKKTERLVEDMYLENLIMHYDLDGLEIKLLQYISEGKANAKIARKLKTTEHEIEEMTKELYLKLEISEQIQQDYRLVDAQPDYIYN